MKQLFLALFLPLLFVCTAHDLSAQTENFSLNYEQIKVTYSKVSKRTRVSGLKVIHGNRVEALPGYRFRRIRPAEIGLKRGNFFVLEKPGQKAEGTFTCSCSEGSGSCQISTGSNHLVCSGGSCSGCALVITTTVPGVK